MKKDKPKYISEADAVLKLQHYCAYQERCHKEVRSKLLDLGVYGDALERVIVELIQDNFLNEERFAKSYAGGKFRIKKWGRIRIKRELKLRNISAYCIKKGMEEIEDIPYYETLEKLLEKKNNTLRESNTFKRRGKLAEFAMRKGYESHLVWEAVKELVK